jgi:hypothetical protein
VIASAAGGMDIEEVAAKEAAWMVVVQTITLILVFLSSVIFTHRIAGPLYKLGLYFRELRRFELSKHLRLRRQDFLQGIATDYNLTVDVLRGRVEGALRARQGGAGGRSLSGVVAALRARADEIRQRELLRALSALPHVDAAVRTQMEWLSVSLVNKLLDEPTRRLRAEASQGQANPYADATRELFGLTTERADLPPA